MDELVIGDQKYVSSKRAAQMTGYAKDYIGQLCREGRVEARLVGRNWYVREAAIQDHRFGEEKKEEVKTKVQKVEKEEKKAVDASWESPKYNVEAEVSIPPVREKASPSALEADTATQMQNVWQEWFSSNGKKPSPAPSESPKGHESEDSALSREQIIAQSPVLVEEEAMPQEPIQDVEEVAQDSEAVEIHINREEPQEVSVVKEEPREYIPPRERIRTKQELPRSYLALKALLVCMALGTILFTVVATGFIDLGSYSIGRAASSYISGEEIISK